MTTLTLSLRNEHGYAERQIPLPQITQLSHKDRGRLLDSELSILQLSLSRQSPALDTDAVTTCGCKATTSTTQP